MLPRLEVHFVFYFFSVFDSIKEITTMFFMSGMVFSFRYITNCITWAMSVHGTLARMFSSRYPLFLSLSFLLALSLALPNLVFVYKS